MIFGWDSRKFSSYAESASDLLYSKLYPGIKFEDRNIRLVSECMDNLGMFSLVQSPSVKTYEYKV